MNDVNTPCCGTTEQVRVTERTLHTLNFNEKKNDVKRFRDFNTKLYHAEFLSLKADGL